jgi:hypothetical protein
MQIALSQSDICEFESYMPSQAVSSLWLRRSTYGACLGVARLTVSRAFELALSVRSPADEWEQRARGEPEKAKTGQSRLRPALKTGVT